MQFNAVARYVRVSPRKLTLLVKSVNKSSPQMVVATLTHLNKSGAKPLRVLFESVLANAKLKGVSADSLEINSLQVNKGPAMKRFRPVSRGMAHEYKKSMSHINLSLKTKEVVKVAVAKQEKKAPSEKKLNTN